MTERLTEEGAKAFVEIIDKIEESTKIITLEMAEEKFETRLAQVGSSLRTEMAEMKTELRTGMAEIKTELRTEMAEMKTELRTEIEKVRSEIAISQTTVIRWMVSIAIGQLAIILAVLAIFLK